jgi:histidinol-phosphate/aromatic aminotransferase/cobyric acid decarboxylase-like protein
MKLLKQQTGLNFKWKGVTPIKVEESTTKLNRIDATEIPSDARRGIAPFFPVNPNNPLGFALAG